MNKINAKILLENILAFGNKACLLAQLIRQEKELFDILIQTKSSSEFVKFDYKTFADVLIQEMVRFELNRLSKGLGNNLYGEESNEFTNKLDVKITIEFDENNPRNTFVLINSVLEDSVQLSEKLSEIIHSDVSSYFQMSTDRDLSRLENIDLSLDNIEFWIDPIDGTSQYITGKGLDSNEQLNDLNEGTLRNVTVLIGAYYKDTGQPFLGYVGQPFWKLNQFNTWEHSSYWGINLPLQTPIFSSNISATFTNTNTIYTSVHDRDILTQLFPSFTISTASSAGYKFLFLFNSMADCYILTRASTFKWDICGPHSILKSCGGGLCLFNQFVRLAKQLKQTTEATLTMTQINELANETQLRYDNNVANACNNDGILAYNSIDNLSNLVQHL